MQSLLALALGVVAVGLVNLPGPGADHRRTYPDP
jgi:hypothetical protein